MPGLIHNSLWITCGYLRPQEWRGHYPAAVAHTPNRDDSCTLTTWTEKPSKELAEYYEPKKPLYAGDSGHTETKTLGWLKQTEHPDGLLCRPCPVCGYKYGTEWRYMPIPEEDEKIILKLLKTGEL